MNKNIDKYFLKKATFDPYNANSGNWNIPGYYELILNITKASSFGTMIELSLFNYASNTYLKGDIGFYYSSPRIVRCTSTFFSGDLSTIKFKKYIVKDNQIIFRIATNKSFLNSGIAKIYCTSYDSSIFNCEFKYYPGIKEIPTEGTEF